MYFFITFFFIYIDGGGNYYYYIFILLNAVYILYQQICHSRTSAGCNAYVVAIQLYNFI